MCIVLFLSGTCLVISAWTALLISKGNFLPLITSQVIADYSVQYSLIAINFTVAEIFIICHGPMAQSISCLI